MLKVPLARTPPCLVLLVPLARRVPMARWAHKARPGLPARLAPTRRCRVPLVLLARQARPGLTVLKALPDPPAPLAWQERLALRVRQARPVPMAR